MTQLQQARAGVVTDAMRQLAGRENIDPEAVREAVASGHVAIPLNKSGTTTRVLGVGRGLTVKVNANIGTSPDYADREVELAKLQAALDAGADAVMDLSTGGDLRGIRAEIRERCDVALGSVPIYEAAADAARAHGDVAKMTADDMLAAVRRHAEDGVDFVTVHCGVTRDLVRSGEIEKRTCGIVSRGGTFTAHWIRRHGQENPLYERFDELVDIALEHDVTLSLGDGLRPGSIGDALDTPQVEELLTLAGLARRAIDAGVQVVLEGPGHVPLDQVETQIRMQKELTGGLPFYVLGPIVTDVAPGYDHITSAIGGAVAAMTGADWLCYVTPTEHLGLPRPEDVHAGVVAARIAAHAGDLARGGADARAWDERMSRARAEQDWDTQLAEAIDPELARRLREARRPEHGDVCSMCGDFCVFKVTRDEAQTKT